MSKLFDFVIGNPPYQDESLGGNEAYRPPVYNIFMNESYKIGKSVELIHPARFLFNAGSTPKAWNKQMLNDKHFKVLKFETDSLKIFPTQNITGGIAVSYYDSDRNYCAIQVFSQFPELNTINTKVTERMSIGPLSEIAYSAYSYHLTSLLYEENPQLQGRQSNGHDYDLKSNVFETLPEVFFTQPQSKDDIRILGRCDSLRTFRWIKRNYISAPDNLDYYKVVLAGADGAAGTVGNPVPARIVGKPSIGYPGDGSTESFSSIGKFSTLYEAESLEKYIRSKFARALLGVLKVTQNITPQKWEHVPLQNFTATSDINWNTSIHEIDLQLYAKYKLNELEIKFIEKNIQEMT